MTHVRIGVAKRVHFAEMLITKETVDGVPWHWATATCRKWAGLAKPTTDPVTCVDCLRGK